jgi:monoamine oxidase
MLDVAIIGAGAAGLGAAKTAISKGLSYKVLEAAPFTGGRSRTDTQSLGVPCDLGCRSLYGGDDNPFQAYALENGVRLEPDPENIAFHDGLRFLDSNETKATIAAFERLELDLVSAHEKFVSTPGVADRSQLEAIDTDSPGADFFLQAMHLECTAPAKEISLSDSMNTVLTTAGKAVRDGYGALIHRVASEVEVVVDCPVSAIDLSAANIVLDTPEGQIEARTVVVTVSTAVLAAERIVLRPGGWPNQKLTAIESLPLGSVTQVGIRLEPGAIPAEFVQLQGDTISRASVNCLMPEPQNLLWLLGAGNGDLAIAYLGGVFSRELALQGEEAQADWAKQQLSVLFGNSIKSSVIATCATPFDREPWIGGGYAYCRYGSGNQRAALAEPIEDRLFFAGEACSSDHPGTAHGAWLSGVAAIEQISETGF